LVRIQRVGHLTDAARRLVAVPDELLDALYEAVGRFVGVEMSLGEHVEGLVVDGRVVRVNLFADADGTLWVTGIGMAP